MDDFYLYLDDYETTIDISSIQYTDFSEMIVDVEDYLLSVAAKLRRPTTPETKSALRKYRAKVTFDRRKVFHAWGCRGNYVISFGNNKTE